MTRPPPEPDDEVPEFIREEFETESPSKLRAIAAYEEDRGRQGGVPTYVRNAFTIQSDDVTGAVAEYATDLAAYLESEGYDSLADAPEPESDSSEKTMGSAFYNPGRSKGGSDDDDDDDDGGLLGGLLGDD